DVSSSPRSTIRYADIGAQVDTMSTRTTGTRRTDRPPPDPVALPRWGGVEGDDARHARDGEQRRVRFQLRLPTPAELRSHGCVLRRQGETFESRSGEADDLLPVQVP